MTHLLFGATGLIGSHLATLIPENDLLITVTRKPLTLNRKNHINVVNDLSESSLEKLSFQEKIDVAYSCLGTTIKVAGSQEKFYQVDHDLVVNVAKLTDRLGIRKLLIISALGADAQSTVFYNRVKGEMELDVAIATPHVEKVVFLRPSLLLGDRSKLAQPERFGEKLAIQMSPLFNWIMQGPLKKYRPIPASLVAKKMLTHHDNNSLPQNRVVALENESLFTE